jgi:glutathione S-transferase
VNGRIEYLDEAGAVVRHTDAATARSEYLSWCAATGTAVHPALTVAA